jgi:lambda repressor-like predicted transcriptional regulator
MKRDCEHPRARHEHGTAVAYARDACRCPDCREAHRQKAEHTRKQKAYGRYTKHHRNPDKARQHIQALKQAGISYNEQSKLSGLTVDTIKRIARNQPRTITHTTEARILQIQPDQANPDTTYINPTGTARRIQALTTQGWDQHTLARELGIPHPQLTHIIHYNRRVTQTLANQARTLYNQLWNQTPPQTPVAKMARTAARKNGWLPPLAWDDEQIDDPAHLGYPKDVAA